MQSSRGDVRKVLNCLRLIVRALRLFDRETQSRHGISAAQMFVLHALREGDGISLNQLAELTATDQSSASVVVQRLVEAGYLKRSTNERDRRRVEIRLTPAGRKIARRTPHPTQDKLMKSIAAMPASQRKQLVRLMEKLVNGMGIESPAIPMLFDDYDSSSSRRQRKRG